MLFKNSRDHHWRGGNFRKRSGSPPRSRKNSRRDELAFRPRSSVHYTFNPAMDYQILLSRYEFLKTFPAQSVREIQSITPDKIQQELANRESCLEQMVITIDGDTAKDFDDAISVIFTEGVYTARVHIADVSFFVPIDSVLDKQAYIRGNSTYLLDRVLPMLPLELSEDQCSLVQGEIRLTFSCEMQIDQEGVVESTRFYKSYIENRRRCTYKEVQNVLEGKKSLGEDIDAMLHRCSKLRTILRKRRIERGALDMELPENEFVMEDSGEVSSIRRGKRLQSEEIIEELMLLANQASAECMQKSGVGIYRIHEPPTSESSQEFWQAAIKMGVDIKKYQNLGSTNPLKDPQKSRYQIMLDSIPNSAQKQILCALLLRSLSKARYSEQNSGHFGLSFSLYTHFTSPIRRYSDLLVHRILSKILLKKKVLYSKKSIETISKYISFTERKSEDAEREYKKIKTIRYLSPRIGQKFVCVVRKITAFGIFVQDIECGIEGFVDNRWFMNEEDSEEINYAELGEEIQVELVSLDPKRLHIDFKPV